MPEASPSVLFSYVGSPLVPSRYLTHRGSNPRPRFRLPSLFAFHLSAEHPFQSPAKPYLQASDPIGEGRSSPFYTCGLQEAAAHAHLPSPYWWNRVSAAAVHWLGACNEDAQLAAVSVLWKEQNPPLSLPHLLRGEESWQEEGENGSY